MKKAGPWLVIGTRGEGLALVNTKNGHLHRVELTQNDVNHIDISGLTILVNGEKVALPVSD
ncbi:unnamed protein product [marine sediment metagenome]|uniref:Uncharacterized protein n=1 Tax=marine sediment metagenome TaxID=412755 RepID=X1T5X1_9ZZZZ